MAARLILRVYYDEVSDEKNVADVTLDIADAAARDELVGGLLGAFAGASRQAIVKEGERVLYSHDRSAPSFEDSWPRGSFRKDEVQ